MNKNLCSGIVSNDVTSASNLTPSYVSNYPDHRLEDMVTADKLDSGIGSEWSQKNLDSAKRCEDRQQNNEMECLFTSQTCSIFLYEKLEDQCSGLVPVVSASLVQPSLSFNKRADCHTIQVSCFDFFLSKCNKDFTGKDFMEKSMAVCTVSVLGEKWEL